MIGVNIDITERKRQKRHCERARSGYIGGPSGRMYAFEWDATSDVIVRSGECADILNWIDDPTRDTGREFAARVHLTTARRIPLQKWCLLRKSHL